MGCCGRCKKALVQTRTKYIKHGKNPIVAEGGRVDATNKLWRRTLCRFGKATNSKYQSTFQSQEGKTLGAFQVLKLLASKY